MARSRVALVIPALNEERSIGEIVARAAAYGRAIVVDDGSTDRTAQVAAAAGADVVLHAVNKGYDAALNSAFRRVSELGMELAITLDADGQHDPRLISRFIDELDRGAEVVVGIRDRRQRLAEHVFAWWGRRLWGLLDPLCGMKGYRMTVYAEHGCFDSCRSIGTELAICAVARERRLEQISVPTRTRVTGLPRFGTSVRANLRILRALWAVTLRAHAVRRRRRSGT